MRLEKSKNTKRNVMFGFINKIITIFLPFLLRTIIIKMLGSEYLGLNNLFSSILQVLNLSELGFSSAVVYSMYKPIAEEDHPSICALLNFYRKVYQIIGVAVLVIGVIVMPFLPKFITGDIPDNINIYVLFMFYIINTIASYLFYAYKNSLLNAYQRQDILSNILTITQGGMYISQIVILLVTKNYYLYLALMPIFTIINNILVSYKVNYLFPEYKCIGKIQQRELATMKKQIPGLMINKLCYISRNSFDSIFISSFLGLKMSAIYGNYYYIMNSIVGILMIVSNSILAGVGNSQVVDSPENNYRTMNKINFVYMWISGWCTICLLCLYQPFMNLWVGSELSLDFRAVILICIYFYSLEMGVIRGVYSDAAGLWWENRYRAIIESVLNLVLNYVLVQFWGIYGIISATLISLILINFIWGSQIVFKYYFKNNKEGEYFATHSKYAFVTVIISAATVLLTRNIAMDGIKGLLLVALICVVVPNFLYITIYRHSKEYKNAMPWVLKVFHLQKIEKFLA